MEQADVTMDPSQSLVASIAQRLNSAQIPCVLWGHFLFNVHGIPSIIDSIDFVIPDDCLEVGAKEVAQIDSLTMCPDMEGCRASSTERFTPGPAFHLHVKGLEITAGLYVQSETLWFLPPLQTSLSFPTKLPISSDFLFASDQTPLPPWRPGRGSGVFQPGNHEVIVPKAHILLEAFLRIHARDSGKRVGSFGISMITYIEEYVDDDGLLDVNQLPEPLRSFYVEFRQGGKPVWQWNQELKAALGVAD
ncbi:hypothetical protein AAE478_007538 [Parahypoxylon ruwenzoriense]